MTREIGFFFMTRGIELSLAVARHIKVDTIARIVRGTLPISKTDPKGTGTELPGYVHGTTSRNLLLVH